MTKPDKLCGKKPGSPMSRGALALIVLFGERVKANGPTYTYPDLLKELAALGAEVQQGIEAHTKKEKK